MSMLQIIQYIHDIKAQRNERYKEMKDRILTFDNTLNAKHNEI